MLNPAAPAPFIIILQVLMSLLASFVAFINPAKTAIEVPCWSSWNTGSRFLSWSCFSIEKHSGDRISSRFIALSKWVRFRIAETV